MKKLFILFILPIAVASAQDAKKILEKAHYACQTPDFGYYELNYMINFLMEDDSSSHTFKTHFTRLENDSIWPVAFHYSTWKEGEYVSEKLYTGNELINFSVTDSSGEIVSKELWGDYIRSWKHNYTLFDPIVREDAYPILHPDSLSGDKFKLTYVDSAFVYGNSCHHLILEEEPENDGVGPMKTLSITHELWISYFDYMPIQYTTTYIVEMNGDTFNQFERFRLQRYVMNRLLDKTKLAKESIPAFVRLKDFAPTEQPELLSEGSKAPDWSYKTLNGKSLSSKNLKGKLVLIDFFYKSCYPCILALPHLQSLHEKYESKGLVVVGLDPYDTDPGDIKSFMEERDVSYPICLIDKQTSKDYHVSGYPTLYLIAPNGTVLHADIGYSGDLETELEEVISSNLPD